MRLEFAHSEINEYLNGNLYFKNDGEAFEVPANVAADLLNAKHYLNGEFVDIFRPADKQARIVDEESAESGYPVGFPMADELVAAGYQYPEVLLLDRDQLIDIKGIGPKTADIILEFNKE